MIVLAALLVAAATALVIGATFTGVSARTVDHPISTTRHDHDSERQQHRRIPLRTLRKARPVVVPTSVAAWTDDLSRALRHGSTLHAALTHTVPSDPVIEQRSVSLRHWLDRGATVADACDEWADELADGLHQGGKPMRRQRGDGAELLATMSAVLAATASLGGATAAPLDRFAVTMRQRASDDLERSAQSAQAKMSAKVLTSVPVAVLILLLLTDADVRSVLTSAAGGAVVAIGLGLNAAGAVWMRRIAGTAGRVSP